MDYSDAREALDDEATARATLYLLLRNLPAAWGDLIGKLPLDLQLKLSRGFEEMKTLLKEDGNAAK